MTDADNGGEISSESRGWAAAAHLIPLLGLGFIGFIAPLIIWLIKRDEDPYVEEHSREALNFQITILIYVIVGIILLILLIGFLILAAVAIFALIFAIVAGVKAATGKPFRYPLTLRLVKA